MSFQASFLEQWPCLFLKAICSCIRSRFLSLVICKEQFCNPSTLYISQPYDADVEAESKTSERVERLVQLFLKYTFEYENTINNLFSLTHLPPKLVILAKKVVHKVVIFQGATSSNFWIYYNLLNIRHNSLMIPPENDHLHPVQLVRVFLCRVLNFWDVFFHVAIDILKSSCFVIAQEYFTAWHSPAINDCQTWDLTAEIALLLLLVNMHT